MPDSTIKKPVVAATSRAAKPPLAKAKAAPVKAPVAAKAAEQAKPPAVKAPAAKPAPAKPVAATPAAEPKPAAAKPAPAKPIVEAPKAPAAKTAPIAVAPKPVPAAAPAPIVAEAPAPVAAKVPEPVVVKVPERAPVVKAEPVAAPEVIVPKPVAAPAAVPVEVVSVVTKPEPGSLVAAASQKGTDIMNETVKKVEETTQKLFGDIKGRATAAYEKSSKLAEESVEFHKGNFEAIVESSKLAAKGAESLGQEAAEFGRKSFESATATMKSFASAKTPTELFKLQSDYAKSSFDTFVAEASKASEAWMKLGNEVFQPISSRISVAVEKVKTASAI